jgi:curli biogenesis system outer membrane secretion channel CsgG
MKRGILAKVVFFLLTFVILSGFLITAHSPAGLKKVVAVSRFENKTSYSGHWHIGDGMADQLTDSLIQSGQFVVLERQTLSDVIGEQDLAASGRTMKSKSAKTGKLTSAQILVKGAVTEFQQSSAGGGTGIGIGGFRIKSKSGEAHVGLIIRVIDTTTGEVLDSHRVEGKAKSGGFALGVDLGSVDFGTGGFKKTPIGKATQIAIDNAVEFIAAKLRNLPYQGRIIKVKAEEVYLTASEKTGASVGDVFTVYSEGEELVDPDTGEILDVEVEEVGTVEVFQVKEKYSKAKVVSGEGMKRGDIIRSK